MTRPAAAATTAFRQCVTDETHRGWVESVNATAEANGVTGTPTMFLNGRPVDLTTLTPASLVSAVAQAGAQ